MNKIKTASQSTKGFSMVGRKPRVLFLCVHNSARSQIAEALFKQMCSGEFEAESAGLEPGQLNPLAVEVLREEGIDIREKETRDVWDVIRSGQPYAYVITVCDQASAERCPIFPGITHRLHWDFPDPSQFVGTWDERLEETRGVREMIRTAIQEFCAEHCSNGVSNAIQHQA